MSSAWICRVCQRVASGVANTEMEKHCNGTHLKKKDSAGWIICWKRCLSFQLDCEHKIQPNCINFQFNLVGADKCLINVRQKTSMQLNKCGEEILTASKKFFLKSTTAYKFYTSAKLHHWFFLRPSITFSGRKSFRNHQAFLSFVMLQTAAPSA